jgi:hypothetical protein
MSARVEKVRAMLYALTPDERNELLASLAPVVERDVYTEDTEDTRVERAISAGELMDRLAEMDPPE